MALRWRSALILLLGVVLCFAVCAMGLADKCKKDQKLTIDQLPAAVKATLLNEAQGGTIQDIEKEEENGIVFYSADIINGTEKKEVEIALDGKLIPAGLEEDKDAGGKDEQGEIEEADETACGNEQCEVEEANETACGNEAGDKEEADEDGEKD